jgi:hypothetical protein
MTGSSAEADLHTNTLAWARKHLAKVETNLKEMNDAATMPDVVAICVVLDALEVAERERDTLIEIRGRLWTRLGDTLNERHKARAEAGRLREFLGLPEGWQQVADRYPERKDEQGRDWCGHDPRCGTLWEHVGKGRAQLLSSIAARHA